MFGNWISRLQRIIKDEHFANIEKDPFKATPLSYEFKGLWSYHFSYKGAQYRIVYEIYPEDQIILVIMIGTREGFYQALRRRAK
jgi:mRNA-degrading endonuclease RelE of RelBE toxin-antitoxin system